MDIIGHLARTVTPAVLGDNHNPQNESLLKQFYALFAAKLSDNDTFNRLGTQEINREDLGLFDRLWTDETQKSNIANELAAHNNVDVISVKGLLASAAPLAGLLGVGAAGAHALNANAATGAAATPTAAHANTAGHRISDTTSNAPLQREEKEGGGFLKALLPIIGLIILAALAWALLKGCQKDPAPVASPEQTVQQPAETAGAGDVELDPAVLTLATGVRLMMS